MRFTVGSIGGTGLLTRTGELPPLAVGDTISVKVVGFKDGKYLIMVKGQQMEAESKIPLQIGERLNVRIEALEPRVILAPIARDIVSDEEGSLSAGKMLLRLFRQDPDLLGSVFTQGREILTSAKIEVFRRFLPAELLEALSSKLAEILTRGKDLGDLARFIGLFHEREVMEGARRPESLKSLLLKLSDNLEKIPGSTPKELEELSRWMNSALNRIEACQVVNVLSRERDGLIFLPLPFLFGGELRVGEFFARVRDEEEERVCQAWVFLDLPNLGPLLVELRLTGGRLSVLVRCEKDGIRDFLRDKQMILKEKLEQIGFSAATIGFSTVKGLDDFRQNLWQGIPAYREGTVQVTI